LRGWILIPVVLKLFLGLGGTSFLNFMIYLRGNPRDYDNWANITGDESWNYNNLLPHFKAVETYYGPPNGM